MQAERKARLQAAIDKIKEIKLELNEGLGAEAKEALGLFDEFSDEYETMDAIDDYFVNADDRLQEAIDSLEEIFGEDGADDEPTE